MNNCGHWEVFPSLQFVSLDNNRRMLMHDSGELKAEKPLNSAQKTALIVSGLGTIALCYAFSIFAILTLLVILAGDLVVWLAGARFGLTAHINPVIKRHSRLFSIFVRSFSLPKAKEYRLLLIEKDAPRLFSAVSQLARHFDVAPPREISIEMNANAWVKLDGYRRGSSSTTLAVGYDLLAGLSESEVQSVLAHEMGHARFVRRGLRRWFNLGVARIGTVTGKLSDQTESYRASGKKFRLAEAFVRTSDGLTRVAARLMASYCRQDEFEADKISAELFGSASMRSALIKLELLSTKLNRVPWTERVAQLEAGASFSRWLVNELQIDPKRIASEIPSAAHDPYSTHPSLRDRIDALPIDNGKQRSTSPGIELLSSPDQVASDLIVEVHRVGALVEQEDSGAVMRWIGKDTKTSGRRRFWVAMAVFVVGVTIAIGLLTTNSYEEALASVFLFGILGSLLLIGPIRRGRVQIPIPRYADMKKAWQAARPPDYTEQEKQIETELSHRIAAQSKKKHKLSLLIEEGARALAKCEYLRAHTAGRLAIDLNNKNVDGVLVYLVASAGLGLWSNFSQNFEFVRVRTALSTSSATWASAWTLFLAGDWSRAEGLLLRALERQPQNTTLLAMLAVTQSQRNKFQSAVLNATKAADLEPNDQELAKLATRLLLDGGRLREAISRLHPIESQASSDSEIAVMVVRLRLLKHQYKEAREAADVARQADKNSSQGLIDLAGVFESARQDECAVEFYREALTVGHYPEALLGLARLAANEQRRNDAKELLISALNLEQKTAPKGRTAIELFYPLVSQLSFLEDPRADCKAWIVTFPPGATPAALAERSLMLFGTTRYAAESHLDFVLKAMQPGNCPNSSTHLQWREAPADKQPARPVREGIQAVL